MRHNKIINRNISELLNDSKTIYVIWQYKGISKFVCEITSGNCHSQEKDTWENL